MYSSIRRKKGKKRKTRLGYARCGGAVRWPFSFFSLLEAKFADYDKQLHASQLLRRRNLAGLDVVLANPALSRWHFRNRRQHDKLGFRILCFVAWSMEG
jgi:hypothetical protein